jgi:putative OmpL-like beta-barrel porin-2
MLFGLIFCASVMAVSPAAFAQGAPDGGTGDAGVPPSPEDQKLLEEIEAATAAPQKGAAAPPEAAAAPAAAEKGKASSFFSNVFNPAMSVNGLFLGSFSSEKNPPASDAQSGLAIQEIEVQVLANVDPYLSANVVLSLPAGTNIGVEEGYLSLTPQPFGIGLRAGQLKVPFGRENMTHTHAFPFIDKSLIGTAVFGDEGLGEVGIEGTYLVPVSWYLLITASVLNGDNVVAFNSPNGRDLAGFGAIKNVFDLSDDATAELQASYVAGKNAALKVSQVAGAHLVLKWKPASYSTTRSAIVTIEGMYSHVPTAATSDTSVDTYGFYSYAQWQLAQRWYVGGRYEYLRPAAVVPQTSMRESAILVFAPTEFSAFRLQANVHQPGGGLPQVFETLLQANFTLGAHPAHSY